MNKLLQNNSYKPKFSFIYLHLFFCSIGLAGFAYIVAVGLANLFIDPFYSGSQFLPWVALDSTAKLSQLFWYGLIVLFLFLYYGILLPWLNSIYRGSSIKGRIAEGSVSLFNLEIIFLIGTLVTNLFILYIVKRAGFVGQIGGFCIWLVILFSPFVGNFQDFLTKDRAPSLKKYKYLMIAMLIGSCFAVFSPYLTGGLPVANEFSDIPEYTFLHGRLVSNNQYINENKIGSLVRNDLYHPEESREALNQFGVRIQNDQMLTNWLSKHEKSGLYFYNPTSQMLYMKNPKMVDIDELAKSITDPTVRANLYSAINLSQVKTKYSRESIDFIKLNSQELTYQAIAGHFFHHQFTVIEALNEYILGKPANEINFVYGWGNTIAFAKVLEAFGGLNFERYTLITYMFYPLYYLLVLGVVAYIFRDSRYVLFAAVAAMAALMALGFENIRFAPGFSPIRHFLDMFVLLTFFVFCRTEKIRYFVLSTGITIMAIWADKEFGLALFVALMGAAAIVSWRQVNRVRVWVVMALAFLSALAVFSQIPVAINQTMQYTMLGVSLPGTPTKILLGAAIAIGFGYILLILPEDRNAYWKAALFWFMYCQGIFIYYIWNPSPNHFMMLGSSWVMLFILMLKQLSPSILRFSSERATLLVATIAAAIVLAGASVTYLYDYFLYKRIFETHLVYNWSFKKVDFKTTMDPKFFMDSVQLINAYEPSHRLYLISKYDDLLPVLANKYSGMVYSQLALNLVTDLEMRKTIERIQTLKPRFLFVDTDILRPQVGDIYNNKDIVSTVLTPIGDYSKGRAMMLENMKSVFLAIEGDYRLIARSPLISVYERKIH